MASIWDVIAVRPNGENVTILDRTVETLKVGGFMSDAAARTGLDMSTMNRWLRNGARVAADLLAERRTAADLDDDEREHLRFHHAVAEAEADGKVTLLGLTQRLAVGGIRLETITEEEDGGRDEVRHEDGRIYLPAIPPRRKRVVKVEHTLPDATTIRWRLERRFPNDFGRVSRMELTGAEGGPIELADRTPMDRLLDTLDQLAVQRAEARAAIEVTGVEGVESLPPEGGGEDGEAP